MIHFIIAYHISLVKTQDNYCNNNLLILDVKQLNKIIKLYYFHALKALWDGQGKTKMYYGCPGLKSSYREKVYFIAISGMLCFTLNFTFFPIKNK